MGSRIVALEDHNKKVISYRRQLLCFVSPAGNNKIREWYQALGPVEKATADEFIKNMRRKREWAMPDYRPSLRGKPGYRRLGELRWECNNVQHRLVGYFQDEAFAIMIGCTHKQQRYNPEDALETAVRRRKQVEGGEASLHEYDL